MKSKEKFFKRGKAYVLMFLMAFMLLAPQAYASELGYLIPMGSTVGIEVSTDGVMVVGLSGVDGESGVTSPAGDAGIVPGDVVVRLGECAITNAQDFIAAVTRLTGETVTVTVRRAGRLIQYSVMPLASASGTYQLGMWLRDGVSGIGTVTFVDPVTGFFGALGHSISDASTGLMIPVGSGRLTASSVVGIQKGCDGSPGQLRGSFDTLSEKGSILANTEHGIFGIMDVSELNADKALPVARESEITTGAAKILCNINDTEVTEYDIEITKLYNSQDTGRSFMLTICDEELLEATGGIVQGMSGSPVIQNGKLIGSVTHVLINDSKKGYGISAERMLLCAQQMLTIENAA